MKALQNTASGSTLTPNSKSGLVKCVRIVLVVVALTAIVGLIPDIASRAQRPKEGAASVASVSSRTTATGSVVTIAADTSINRAQTWQDSEGYHVTLPYSGTGEVKGSRGVKVRQVGRSLEVVVQVKPGTNVTVQPQSNRLTLQVDGSLDHGGAEREENAKGGPDNTPDASDAKARVSRGRTDSSSASQDYSGSSNVSRSTDRLGNQDSNTSPASQSAGRPESGVLPEDDALSSAPAAAVTNPPVASEELQSEGTFGSMLMSVPGILGVICIALIGLIVVRRRNAAEAEELELPEGGSRLSERALLDYASKGPGDHKPGSLAPAEQSLSLVRSNGRNDVVIPEAQSYAAGSLFGAYRVDQEVGKLVLGQPHRMDVLASRAPEDRRAMEVALIKALNSADVEEDGRRRARQALEEYGFVARQSATLLLGHDVCERASAARSLGEIGAASSLPFLLEALYDRESIVRNQCVSSLGTLKLPSAIGALLDVARRHPSIPDSLLSNALSACSVESLDFFDVQIEQPVLLSGPGASFTGEITQLEYSGVIDELPDFVEDSVLIEALAQLESPEADVRGAAVRQLALFPVRRSVEALASVAIQDPEAGLRASAVSCLGSINHESVFAPVLIALADESREVQAAAARSLTGLSFDRADAYVRLMETSNPETLRQVAQACITAGIVSQAIDRLASTDRRQAYEAFSLVSLLAKANETGPIFKAITDHADSNVRMCAVRILGLSGQLQVGQELRQFAGRDDIPEHVRTSILEVIYKSEQAQTQNSAK